MITEENVRWHSHVVKTCTGMSRGNPVPGTLIELSLHVVFMCMLFVMSKCTENAEFVPVFKFHTVQRGWLDMVYAFIFKHKKSGTVEAVTVDSVWRPDENYTVVEAGDLPENWLGRFNKKDLPPYVLILRVPDRRFRVPVTFDAKSFHVDVSIDTTIVDAQAFVEACIVRNVSYDIDVHISEYLRNEFATSDPAAVDGEVPILPQFVDDGVKITLKVTAVQDVGKILGDITNAIREAREQKDELMSRGSSKTVRTAAILRELDADILKHQKGIEEVEKYSKLVEIV